MKPVSLDKVFFFNFFKFVLKTWISRGMSYFVGILSGVGDIFVLGCPLVFSLWNVGSRGISKPQKSPIQREEFCFIYIYIYTLALSYTLCTCNEALFWFSVIIFLLKKKIG